MSKLNISVIFHVGGQGTYDGNRGTVIELQYGNNLNSACRDEEEEKKNGYTCSFK